MHAERKEEAQDVPAVSPLASANRDDSTLIDLVKTFTRTMRANPHKLILDGFDCEFYIVFDFSPDPENPATTGTCDITIVPLMIGDYQASTIRLVENANWFSVMRFLAALGIERFNDDAKAAFYQSTNALRAK